MVDAETLGIEHRELGRGAVTEAFFRSHPQAIVVFDPRTLELLALNPAARRCFGLSPDALHGLRVVDLHPESERPALVQAYRDAAPPYVLPSGETDPDRSVPMIGADGSNFEAVLSVLGLDFRGLPALMMLISDVTVPGQAAAEAETRQALQQRADYLANFDPVTDLPNRQMFETMLLDALTAARAAGRKLALLYLELHGFRLIHDAVGQEAADDMLRAAARRLKSVAGADVVARFGTDEFALITKQLDATVDATGTAQRVIAELVEPLTLAGQAVTFRPRLGVAVFPDHAERPGELIKAASQAKFRAKGSRGPSFAVFRPAMQERARERLALEGELRQALGRGELTLFFQPRMRLSDGSLAAVEALVRWRHPQRGLLSPDAFVPLAEETGLINALGRTVLDMATAQLRRWQDAGFTVPRVAVNLSPLELRGGGLLDQVRAALNRERLAPERLELEVTETAVLLDRSRGAELLRELRTRGVQVTLDDFGTGYASLAHLRELPIDAIKLDRGFLTGRPAPARAAGGNAGAGQSLPASNPATDTAILKAVTALGAAMGIPITAEGVETEEQLRQVAAAGCHSVQGFLIGRPVAPELVKQAAADAALALDRGRVSRG